MQCGWPIFFEMLLVTGFSYIPRHSWGVTNSRWGVTFNPGFRQAYTGGGYLLHSPHPTLRGWETQPPMGLSRRKKALHLVQPPMDGAAVAG